MKIEDVRLGMNVVVKTSGIHAGQQGVVDGITESKYQKGVKLVIVRWLNGTLKNWHPSHLQSVNQPLALGKSRKMASRRIKDRICRDMGLIKVRGALGGTYWE